MFCLGRDVTQARRSVKFHWPFFLLAKGEDDWRHCRDHQGRGGGVGGAGRGGTLHVSVNHVYLRTAHLFLNTCITCILGTVNLVAAIPLFGLTHWKLPVQHEPLSRGHRALYVHCCAHLISRLYYLSALISTLLSPF